MKNFLTDSIDLFYPPFKNVVTLQTFRYAACGGANTFLGLSNFYIGFYYIFNEKYFDVGFFVFEPHSAALLLSSTITFIIGFLLNKFVVFTDSYLRGRVQLFRYFLSFLFNVVVNYFMLKLLVELWNWNVMLSQVLTIIFVIGLSYVSQKHFTFRSLKNNDHRLDTFDWLKKYCVIMQRLSSILKNYPIYFFCW